MELGFELDSAMTLHFSPSRSFKMYIMRGEEILKNTIGNDTFDYNGALFPYTVISATGRDVHHKYESDLHSYMGTAAAPANVDVKDFSELTLWLENNAILSQGELQTFYSLRAVINGRRFPISLLTTKVKVHWLGAGKYCIYLNSLNNLLRPRSRRR